MGRLELFSQHLLGCGAGVVIAGLAMIWPASGSAQPLDGKTIHRTEIFSGVDATSNSLFGYAGVVWAFGQSVSDESLRLKALVGTGAYDYDGSLPGVTGQVNFDGDVALAHLLGGYLWRLGEWTLKAYAGLGFEDHDISPLDPGNSLTGNDFGLLGQLELWRNIGKKSWFSADASYGDVFGSYWAQTRLSHRFGKRISAGVEGGLLGNEEHDTGRDGGFLRYHLGETELTVSAGVSGNYLEDDTGGYAAFGFYRKF